MTPESTFNAFDVSDVKQLVKRTPELACVVSSELLTVEEVGDGNLNQVFFVTAEDGGGAGLVLKQALPYLRVAGEGWPLTLDRMRIETQCLLLHNEIVPSLSPRVFAFSEEQSWVGMEFLHRHQVMRHTILASKSISGAGKDVGEFIGTVAYSTSEMSMTASEKRDLSSNFSNPALCDMQEQFVFTNPFMFSPENSWNPLLEEEVVAVRGDSQLKLAIAEAKMEYINSSEALLHGDLHTGSVMIESGLEGPNTKIIDPEFAFFGPISHDIGTFIANLAIGVLAQEALIDSETDRLNYQRALVGELADAWLGFVGQIESRWTLDSPGSLSLDGYWDGDVSAFETLRFKKLSSIASSVGRQGGCELLRRCMGIVSVAELEAISDLAVRARVERKIIALAKTWLLSSVPLITALDEGIDHLIQPLTEQIGR